MFESPIQILIVEDNPGDVALIEDYLDAAFSEVSLCFARSYKEAIKEIKESGIDFDTILLDLTLPDSDGEELVRDTIAHSNGCPVVVLTGNSDKNYSLKAMELGVADYLLKSEMNGFQLRKSIEYSIERQRINAQLRDSEKKYREIFHLSPLPMWVYDLESLQFLDVNEAAVNRYGYSKTEFLSMTVKDIRHEKDLSVLEKALELSRDKDRYFYKAIVNHQKKDGTEIVVEVQSNIIQLDEKKAELVLANDITEKLETERELIFSEQRFKALVQNGADLIAILDKFAVFKYVSPTSNAILGIAPAAFLKESWFKFIHSEDLENVQNSFNELRTEYRVELSPYRMKAKDASWRWITTTLTDMTTDPVVHGIVSNSRDITESVIAEQRIEESNERYNVVARATSDVIWDWDMNSDQIVWNPGMQTVFGYEKDEISDDRVWRDERLHPEDIDNLADQLREVLRNRQVNWQSEYRFRCADGSYRHVQDRGFIVYNTQQRATRIIGAMKDITRLKSEALEREQLMRELTMHNNDLRQFSYITSHNLRSPLSNMVGLLKLIEDFPIGDPNLQEIINGLQQSTEKLQETIDDLSKIISIKNSPSVQKEQVLLSAMAERTISQLNVSSHPVLPEINIDFSKASTVVFNRPYLESIFLNLFTNALKYKHPERPVRLRIASEYKGDDIVITFADNGLGIDVDRYRDRLFGLYQRFHHHPDGKGIGLFLVKSQMEALGGSISVESTVGKGTTFILTFKNQGQ